MREKININDNWYFSKENLESPIIIPNMWEKVKLPHTWNGIDGQDGNSDYYRGTGYYVKELEKGLLPKADRYYLEICGANSSAEVYVNDCLVAQHHGGYSIWRVDITEYMTEKSIVRIAVDNVPNTSVYPQVADFTFYGGLYRDVNLICVSNSHFDLERVKGTGSLTLVITIIFE